jgi:polyferredoxin
LAALTPLTRPKRPPKTAGESRFAQRLRSDEGRAAAAADVVVLGEPGLRKSDVATRVHFLGKKNGNGVCVQVNLADGARVAPLLFGIVPSRGDLRRRVPGVIDHLLDSPGAAESTLVLLNLHAAPRSLIPSLTRLLRRRRYRPVVLGADEVDGDDDTLEVPLSLRIVSTSETQLGRLLAPESSFVMRVPPLRVRRRDMDAMAEAELRRASRLLARPTPEITPAALRALESYGFPDNLDELESIVRRAVSQLPPSASAGVITAEMLWPGSGVQREYRISLTDRLPWLYRALRSDWYRDKIPIYVSAPAFVALNLVLLFGPHTGDRTDNVGLLAVWSLWWPFMMLLYPFVGRLWCQVCPFMAFGRLAQDITPWNLRSWPHKWADRWGGWIVAGGFAVILAWENLWDLPHSGPLTFALLLLITAGAVLGSVTFEKRFWCRHLCPIGGMNGLFAKLAVVEVRGQPGVCSASCDSYACFKGGPAETARTEGLATDGCPLGLHPAQLVDNQGCTMCMSCLSACPHASVSVNLRPPAADLWTHEHKGRASEAALTLILLGGVFAARGARWAPLAGLDPAIFSAGPGDELFAAHALATAGAIAAPGLAAWGVYGARHLRLGILRRFASLGVATEGDGEGFTVSSFFTSFVPAPSPPSSPPTSPSTSPDLESESFVRHSYALLPLVYCALAAHHLEAGMLEGGEVFATTATTFGLDSSWVPAVAATPDVASFVQRSLVLFGGLSSLALARRVTRRQWGDLRVESGGIIVVTGALLSIMG